MMNSVSRWSPSLQSPRTFTIVVLDLDDTLIPSKQQEFIGKHFGLDIYCPFTVSLLRKLEENIISALKSIKQAIERDNHRMVLSVVSMATTSWIAQCLGAESRKSNGPIKLPTLSKFLKDNDVELASAKTASFEFLHKKMGSDLAVFMIDSSASVSTQQRRSRWLLKYMAIGSIILKYRKRLRRSCTRVISIGDGRDEEMASRHYAEQNGVQCVHFRFFRFPVIELLQTQWAVLESSFSKLLDPENVDQSEQFVLHKMSSFIKTNGNHYFSGSMHQLPALSAYFRLWLNRFPDDAVSSKLAIENVCRTVRRRMATESRTRRGHSKAIILYLIKRHPLFFEIWTSEVLRDLSAMEMFNRNSNRKFAMK